MPTPPWTGWSCWSSPHRPRPVIPSAAKAQDLTLRRLPIRWTLDYPCRGDIPSGLLAAWDVWAESHDDARKRAEEPAPSEARSVSGPWWVRLPRRLTPSHIDGSRVTTRGCLRRSAYGFHRPREVSGSPGKCPGRGFESPHLHQHLANSPLTCTNRGCGRLLVLMRWLRWRIVLMGRWRPVGASGCPPSRSESSGCSTTRRSRSRCSPPLARASANLPRLRRLPPRLGRWLAGPSACSVAHVARELSRTIS
jgi:hypothetical protein